MTDKPLHWSGTKRYLVLMAIMLIMMLCFASSASAEPDYMPGDVNNDGVINVKDVVLVMKHVLNLQDPPLTEVQRRAADVNGDGVIDVRDATEIMKKALGLIEVIPMAITSLEDASVRVPFGTARQDINFPDTVRAHFAGGQKRDVSVRWEQVSTPPYNQFVFNQYEFKGDLVNLPSGVTNPKNLRATAKVSFLMPDPGPFPGPIPPPPPPPPADWPIELEDQILVGGGLANLWLVTLTAKPEYANQVTRITVKGIDANQDSVNLRRWEVLLEQDTRPTKDELRGRITVTTTMPGQIDVIDMTRTAAFFVGAVYDVVVRVYIKPGEVADSVTADGNALTPPIPGRDYWRVYLDGYVAGDQIQINASNIIGVQTRTITVQ